MHIIYYCGDRFGVALVFGRDHASGRIVHAFLCVDRVLRLRAARVCMALLLQPAACLICSCLEPVVLCTARRCQQHCSNTNGHNGNGLSASVKGGNSSGAADGYGNMRVGSPWPWMEGMSGHEGDVNPSAAGYSLHSGLLNSGSIPETSVFLKMSDPTLIQSVGICLTDPTPEFGRIRQFFLSDPTLRLCGVPFIKCRIRHFGTSDPTLWNIGSDVWVVGSDHLRCRIRR